MNSLSSNGRGNQHPETLPFGIRRGLRSESPGTIDTTITPDIDDDGDDFDYDGDTKGAEAPARAYRGAVGAPCTRGGAEVVTRGRPNWSLCIVTIEPDPSCPEDPEYLAEGQELLRMHVRTSAIAACDGYAINREHLEKSFDIQVTGGTHLVVNDRTGREVYRRPLLNAV